MTLVSHVKPHILIADDGFVLRDKTVVVEEGEEPYYFQFCFVPDSIILEQCKETYEEISVDNLSL